MKLFHIVLFSEVNLERKVYMSLIIILKRNIIRFRDQIVNEIKKNHQLYLIVMLPLAFIIVFNYIPLYGVQIAFRDFRAVDGILGSKWVGLKYFDKFFNAYEFERAIKNTLEISIYSLVAGFPIPIILAISLNNAIGNKFKKTVQLITYAPFFISTVVLVGILTQFLSTADYGVVNNVLRQLGIKPIMFMSMPEYFSSVYVWTSIWQGAGWSAIIYIAALSGIDQELYEAAQVDGASRMQRIFHIDIPGILPTIVIVLILSTGQIMNLGYEKVLLMQNDLNISRSEIIATYVYKMGMASALPNYSYAAAIGLFNSVINFSLLIIVNKISKRISETSLW